MTKVEPKALWDKGQSAQGYSRLNTYNTCPKTGGLESIDEICLGLMRKVCLFESSACVEALLVWKASLFGRSACLEGLLVWKACLFGRPACLESLLVWKTDRQTDKPTSRSS